MNGQLTILYDEVRLQNLPCVTTNITDRSKIFSIYVRITDTDEEIWELVFVTLQIIIRNPEFPEIRNSGIPDTRNSENPESQI